MDHSCNTSQVSNSKPVVLVIEDDEDNLLLLTHALELFGYSSISTVNGETALFLIRNYRTNLILLDIVLPDLNGVEFVQHLKRDSQNQTIPVIAVTGLASTKEREQILQAGCSDYLSKPYAFEDLQAAIARHLIGSPA